MTDVAAVLRVLTPAARAAYREAFARAWLLQEAGLLDRPLRLAHFLAQVCHEMGGIPTAIIRVISDQADHSAPVDFLRFIDEVAEYLTGGIVRSLLTSFTTRLPFAQA